MSHSWSQEGREGWEGGEEGGEGGREGGGERGGGEKQCIHYESWNSFHATDFHFVTTIDVVDDVEQG